MEENPKIRRKVCIVDDEASIREIYETALRQSGFDVVTAIDGEDGYRVIVSEKPDIVLVDIMMPKIDGIALMKALKADESMSRIPLVVMTNVDDQSVVKKVGKIDVAFYLIKSLFEPKKVVAIVEEILQNR